MAGHRSEYDGRPMAFNLTRLLVALACAGWIVGVFRAAAVFRINVGHVPGPLFLWTLVPLFSAVGAFVAARGRSIGPIWVLAGTCCGFVVLAAWSLGPFFTWTGLALLGAAVAHTMAVRARWRAALIPVWFLIGATGLCALFLAYDQIGVLRSGGQIIEAPVIVTGSWMFAALVGLLAIERSAAYVGHARTARRT
jgi:hypothetical protein